MFRERNLSVFLIRVHSTVNKSHSRLKRLGVEVKLAGGRFQRPCRLAFETLPGPRHQAVAGNERGPRERRRSACALGRDRVLQRGKPAGLGIGRKCRRDGCATFLAVLPQVQTRVPPRTRRPRGQRQDQHQNSAGRLRRDGCHRGKPRRHRGQEGPCPSQRRRHPREILRHAAMKWMSIQSYRARRRARRRCG